MAIASIVAATLAAYVFGAAWYMLVSKHWIEASGVPCDDTGTPKTGPLIPYILMTVCLLVVAGMTRHVFAMAGITGLATGLTAGFGFGAFAVLPWVLINYTFAARPIMLSVIDGVFMVGGFAVIGAVLGGLGA